MSRLVKSLCSSEDSEKTMVQSHSDESSQTDPSLENIVDSSTSSDRTSLSISIQNLEEEGIELASGESLVTPVATVQDLAIGSLHLSESHDTEEDVESQDIRNLESSAKAMCLNKSESRDSGLHSENASTSDTISSEPQSVISKNGKLCSCEENVTADDTQNASELGEISKSCRHCRNEGICDEVSEVCNDIVNQVVDSALDTCLTLTNGGRYSRQSSWQYNVNIEIPRSSVSDLPSMDQETESSNSDSSTCTLSTSPFNCDTLIVNNADSENPTGCTPSNEGHTSNSDCDKIVTSNYQASMEQVIQEQSVVTDNIHASIPSADRRNENDDPLDIKPCASNQNSKSSQKSENKPKKSIDRIHCRTGSNLDRHHESSQEPSSPRIQKLRYPESVSSSLSSCHSNCDSEWDRERFVMFSN